MARSTKKMPIPLEINWHEGMLLSQHHFQQNDLRQFHVLTHQIKLLSLTHFGVCHLRIDNVALPDGLYRINEMEAVFPDGLIFSYFPETGIKLKPLEIDLSSKMKDQNEVTVYLVIAESSEETSPILGSMPRYYSLDGQSVRDDNIPDNEAKIPRLFPNAFLSVNTIPELCIGFPLCKIIRIEGVYHVKNWTPPCFFIAKHFPMWERCLKLALSIREKATFLSAKLQNQSSTTGFITGTEQILRQLLMILPALEALVYSDNIRPYELYEELAEILGAVAILRPTDMIPVMQPYNHNDIDNSIYPIMALIDHYISIVERGFASISLKKKERFFYQFLSQSDMDMCKNSKLYVGVKALKKTGDSDIENWMSDAIIVSDFAIESVREKRVKGAKRSIASNEVVSNIMPENNIILFEVLIDGKFIKSEQNLHIFNPTDSLENRPIEINLYIPRGGNGV